MLIRDLAKHEPLQKRSDQISSKGRIIKKWFQTISNVDKFDVFYARFNIFIELRQIHQTNVTCVYREFASMRVGM